jgi:peptidoglycan hydrolase-like protein with peptidoglycan-binding domain
VQKRPIVLLAVVVTALAAATAQGGTRETAIPAKDSLAIGWGFMNYVQPKDADSDHGSFVLAWLYYVTDHPARLFVGKMHGHPDVRDRDPRRPEILSVWSTYWQGQTETYRLRREGNQLIVELVFDPGEAPPGERPTTEATMEMLRITIPKGTKVSVLPSVDLDPPAYRRPMYGPTKPVLSGDDVTFVQSLLLDADDVDGLFGKRTSEAVIEYQSANGLDADGVVGPKTWKSLLTLLDAR